MNLDITDLKKMIDDHDNTVKQFETFIDELMAVLARAQVALSHLPRGFHLEYYPSKEYKFRMHIMSFTSEQKTIGDLLFFAEILQSGWLDEVELAIKKQTVQLQKSLETGHKGLDKIAHDR